MSMFFEPRKEIPNLHPEKDNSSLFHCGTFPQKYLVLIRQTLNTWGIWAHVFPQEARVLGAGRRFVTASTRAVCIENDPPGILSKTH